MGIEQLTNKELITLLGDKQETLTLLSEKQQVQASSYMTPGFVRSLENARCRLCVGRVYEELRPIPGDPEGKTKKVTLHEGTAYTIAHGGDKLACRTCKHVRHELAEVSKERVFI